MAETSIETNIDLTEPVAPPIEEPKHDDTPLLAGKYKTAEELERAYKELETKLGQTTEPPTEPTTEPPASEPPTEPLTVVGLPADKYFNEYAEKGELSEDSYKELADKGIPKQLVDAYIAGQKAAAAQQNAMSETVVNGLIEEIGGTENFGKMSAWAATSYSEQEKADYQVAVDSGNPSLARLALANLKAKYEAAFGSAPGLIAGVPAPGTAAFRSNAEMVAAMRDKRYHTDPSYRAEVERKVAAMKI